MNAAFQRSKEKKFPEHLLLKDEEHF